MARVKGKFITLAGSLMSVYPDSRAKADDVLIAEVGRHWNELDPEGWYDTGLFHLFMTTYAEASITGDRAIVTLGRKVYPTIQRTVGLPDHLETPLDFIKYEAEGFLANHDGPDVHARRFIRAVDGEVIVEAPAPDYNSKLYVGVYLGILEMCGITTGKVVQTRSQENGDGTSEFRITW